MLLKRSCGLAALFLMIASAAPAKGLTDSYLATIATAHGVAPLFSRKIRQMDVYHINLYRLIPSYGAVFLASFWSHHPACVAKAPWGSFWAFGNRSHGSEIGNLSGKFLRPRRKFAWRMALRLAGSWPIGTASDRTLWLLFQSKSYSRLRLRIFSPHMRTQVGVYTSPRATYFGYSWTLVGRQAVFFVNTVGLRAKVCHVVVVDEKGQARATDLTSKVGWAPYFLSSAGNLFSGVASGRGIVQKLVSFHVLPSGKVARVRTERITSRHHRWLIVTAFTLLDQHTALASLKLRHGSGYSYELARISVASGRVEKSVPIPYPALLVLRAKGVVYLVANRELVRAYTPALRLLGHYPPYSFVGGAAVASVPGR